MFRYNAKRNPMPSQTSHNPVLEVAWTVIPVLILVVIAIPSFPLVYYEDRTHDPDLTIKVTGHQWYWEYTYPDKGNIDFSSYIVADDQLKPGPASAADVDHPLVLPVSKNIRILHTSGDVIHSFFIPSRWACSGMPFPAARSRPGCGWTSPATTMASATRSAAPTTAGCRSWFRR